MAKKWNRQSVNMNCGLENPCSGEDASTTYFNPWNDVFRTRHNLSHWQQYDVPVFVTFRLADSLPREKLDRWKAEREVWLRDHPEPWDESTEYEYHDRFSRQIDKLLDQGAGCCLQSRMLRSSPMP